MLFLWGSYATAAEISQQQMSTPVSGDSRRKLELATFLEIPSHTILISTDVGQSNMGAVKQRVQWNPTMGPNLGIQATYDIFSIYVKKRFSLLNDMAKKAVFFEKASAGNSEAFFLGS
ncbi:MAG: hypothetical protein HUU57_14150 [Bdellovibrio sp.]|nr:hypothetical protein [Bdellovibrio sp.]